MSQPFTCPQGHRWSLTVHGAEAVANRWVVCPVCGAAGTAPPPATGVAAVPAGADEGAVPRLPREDDPDARPSGRRGSGVGWLLVLILGGGVLALLPVLACLGLLAIRWRVNDEARVAEMEARAMAEEARRQEMQARAAAEQARAAQQELARRGELTLYFANVALAKQEVAAGDIGRAKQVLQECPAALRHWEWRYLRRLAQGETLLVLPGHKSAVTGVAFSPDGSRLASSSSDDTVKFWGPVKGDNPLTLSCEQGGVLGVVFAPDGRRLATAGQNGTLRTWDAAGKPLATINAQKGALRHVVSSADGQTLAACGADNRIRFWDWLTIREVLTLADAAAGPVQALALSPDSKRVASAAADKTVKVWDLVLGQAVLTLAGHEVVVTGVAFSPDGQRLASGGQDGSVKVWDATSGKETLSLTKQGQPITGMAFSPDGKRLATSTGDKVILWDTSTGQEALTIKVPDGTVTSVTFSPDGGLLAAGVDAGKDRGEVRVWNGR